MGSLASGVTVITTIDRAGVPYGLTATAFASVCLEPPTCLVCVARTAEAHPIIDESGAFAVNLLSADHEALSARFATHALDKFANVVWHRGTARSCPILDGTLAFVECVVSAKHAAGDHDVFFGVVESAGVGSGDPLVYYRGRYAHLEPHG